MYVLPRSRDMPSINSKVIRAGRVSTGGKPAKIGTTGIPNNSRVRPDRCGYPWKKWFSGPYPKEFILERGKDYGIRSFAMAQQIRNMACQSHWRIRVSPKVTDDESSIRVIVHGFMPEQASDQPG